MFMRVPIHSFHYAQLGTERLREPLDLVDSEIGNCTRFDSAERLQGQPAEDGDLGLAQAHLASSQPQNLPEFIESAHKGIGIHASRNVHADGIGCVAAAPTRSAMTVGNGESPSMQRLSFANECT